MNNEDNLLSLLYRWAHRQNENFSTEVFAHLIRHLLVNEPTAGVDLLNYLTGQRLSLYPELAKVIKVRTQVTDDGKRPDIEIKSPGRLAYVEVKLEAGLGNQQLTHYRRMLGERSLSHTALVLLTQNAAPEFDVNECPDVCRRWYEVAGYIDRLSRDVVFALPDTPFLIQQFLGFLRWKGLVMERIGLELDAGIRAYRNLMMMIKAACGERPVERGSPLRAYDGYNVSVEHAKVWVGIYLNSPATLCFESMELEVLPDSGKRAGFGTVEPDPDRRRFKWVHRLALDAEGSAFFEKSADEQFKCISEFLDRCFEALPKIKAASLVPRLIAVTE